MEADISPSRRHYDAGMSCPVRPQGTRRSAMVFASTEYVSCLGEVLRQDIVRFLTGAPDDSGRATISVSRNTSDLT